MPAFQRYGFLLLFTAVLAGPSSGQSERDHALPLPALSRAWIPADDTDAARAVLDAARRFVRADTAPPTAVRVRRVLEDTPGHRAARLLQARLSITGSGWTFGG